MSKCRKCSRPVYNANLCRHHYGIAIAMAGKGKANAKAARERLHDREQYKP